jgi:hypothetical protein
MYCHENRRTVNPARLPAHEFEEWMEHAKPEEMEAFGRAWFPWWCEMEDRRPMKLPANLRQLLKPSPKGGRRIRP